MPSGIIQSKSAFRLFVPFEVRVKHRQAVRVTPWGNRETWNSLCSSSWFEFHRTVHSVNSVWSSLEGESPCDCVQVLPEKEWAPSIGHVARRPEEVCQNSQGSASIRRNLSTFSHLCVTVAKIRVWNENEEKPVATCALISFELPQKE